MAKLDVTLNVLNMPELIWAVRCEMATLLKETADAEASPLVAQRLREIATVFEVGTPC